MHRMIVHLVFSVAVWLTPILAISADLDSVLIKSIGGPAAVDSLRTLRSVFISGDITLNGQPGRLTQHFVMPDKYYAEQTFSHFRVQQGYDGETAWQMDHNGQVTELTGYEKRELLKNLYFESYAYITGGDSRDAVYNGVVDGEAGVFHEVLFFPLQDDTVRAYFDTTTGLRTLMQSKLDNTITYLQTAGFRPHHGLLIPHEQRLYSPEMAMMIELMVDSVGINLPTDTTMFSRPDTRQHTFAFPDGTQQTIVPFRFHAGHIYVPVRINGTALLWMILDSGASSSVFHRTAVEYLQLPVVGESSAKGLGGYVPIEMVRVDSIDVGDLTVHSLLPGVADLSGITQTNDESFPFGGVIGNDFLSRFPVLVNYEDNTITIYDPTGFAPASGGVPVPFELTMQVPTVQATVEGVPGRFIVDMGNAFSLVLHHAYIQANDMSARLTNVRSGGLLGGMGGSVNGSIGLARRIELGEVKIDSVEVVLPRNSEGLTGSAELAGNIGNQLLRRYTVLFNYPNNEIIFYPASCATGNP